MLLEAEESQLVLVDYQHKLMPAIHEGERVLANAIRLARVAQLLQVPVWATEENPSGLENGNSTFLRECVTHLETDETCC